MSVKIYISDSMLTQIKRNSV